MNQIICCLLSFFVCSACVFGQESLSDLFDSEPEQIVNMSESKDFLIGNVLNPLSGQIFLRQTDLVAKGAQSIALERIFLPQYRALNEKTGQIHPSKSSYAGWVYFPHTRLNVFIKNETLFGMPIKSTQVCVADPNGSVLTYELKHGNTLLKAEPWGICNGLGALPSGKYDPRNTVILLKSNEFVPEHKGCDVVLRAPDGTERFYFCWHKVILTHGRLSYNCLNCLLDKEVLPNGKILRYKYSKEGQVSKVESLDPQERYVYASLDMNSSPFTKNGNSSTGNGARTTFVHETAGYFKERYQERCVDLLYPLRCQQVSSPFFRDEKISYEDAPDHKSSWLSSFMGKSQIFKCKYLHPRKTDKKQPRSLVTELFLPSNTEKFHSVYTLQYNPVIPGKQGGSTVVKGFDGTKILYEFSANLLFKSIKYFDEKNTLVKIKTFDWHPNQWLKAVRMTDGQGHLLSEKSFEYDLFGNPTVETLRGGLTGHGLIESDTTLRTYSTDGRNLLLSEEFSSGKVVCYAYLPKSNLLVSRLTKTKNGLCLIREFYEYDDANNLTLEISDDGIADSKEDLSGVTARTLTRYVLRQQAPQLHMPEWIEEKYLENGEEKLLKLTKLEYDLHGNISHEHVYGADGQLAYTIHKKYNERGDLLSETNALGQEALYTYDAFGHEKTRTNFSKNLRRQAEYDPKGRIALSKESGSDGIERANQYEYDHKDRIQSQVDHNKLKTTFTYDRVLDIATEVISPSIFTRDGKELQVVDRAEYDPLGRKIVAIDANAQATTFRYNLYDSLTEICYPDNSRKTYHYTPFGFLQSETDADGLTINYEYNPLGQVTCKQYLYQGRLLAREVFEYQGKNLVRSFDKEGHLTQFFFDGAGRKIREEKCGCVTLTSYDALGNVASLCEENGENSLYTYFRRDLLGRVLEKRRTSADGTLLSQVFFAYDADGNVEEIQSEINGQIVKELFAYDSHNRQISHTDAFGNQTTTQYDEQALNPFGQLVLKRTVTDPKRISTIEMHDVYGQVVKSSIWNDFQEVIASEEREYDPCGNLLQRNVQTYLGKDLLDTKVTSYVYENPNRLKSFTRAFGTPEARLTEFTYTPGGRLETKTLPDRVVLTYAYDGLGNIASLSSSNGEINHSFKHNLQGHLLSATDELRKVTIERTLDAHGNVLVEQFFNPDCKPFSIKKSFDRLQRPLSLTLPDGSGVFYERNPCYLNSITRVDATGKALYTHRYESYDKSGYLMTESLIANLGTVRYGTDLLGRACSISGAYFTQNCMFDEVGNLTKTTINGVDQHFAYDDLSQLTQEPEHAYGYDSTYNRVKENEFSYFYNALDERTPSDALACAYDLRGNLINKSTEEIFTYDPLNRLVEAMSGDKKVCYAYDPLGRRVAKRLYSLSDSEWKEEKCECILYDGDHDIGTITLAGVIEQLRILGIGAHPQIPATIAIELDNQLYAPLLDCQRNIRGLVDPSTSSLAVTYNFSAFGEQQIANNAPYNPWQYASKRLDADLNLIDFGQRHYDPSLGRWLSIDPAGFANSSNLYQFNFNNPFRYTDPDGSLIFIPVLYGIFGASTAGLVATVELVAADAIIGSILTGGAIWGINEICEGIDSLIDNQRYHNAVEQGEAEARPKGKRKGTQQTTGTYSPLRPLPITKPGGVPIPDTDVPHTQLGTRDGRSGKYPQAREFGYDGVPVRLIDFTDHGYPENHTNPHQHKYKPNPTGGTPIRGSAEPVPEWRYML